MSDKPTIGQILAMSPVVPVIVIDDVTKAVPMARALLAGGIRVLEITLRTDSAMEAMRRIMAEVEGAIVGAGTVLTPAQLESVAKLGAAFAVSPGATDRLLDAAAASPVPLLPGTATPSEVMTVMERGYEFMKLFPAEAVGGIALLQSLASPLQGARFCPTGGIDAAKAERYLALPNVVCVGGSWLLPKQAVAEGAWSVVTELARAAMALRKSGTS